MITKPINFATEKILSVEDSLIKYQAGLIASPTNGASTFIPCAINKVLSVVVTPVRLGSNSANSVALDTFELESIDTFSTVDDLPAWAASTAYIVDQVVRYNGKAYKCLVSHTSGSTFDAANWKELAETNFLKLNHTAAGAGKVAYFTFMILGY